MKNLKYDPRDEKKQLRLELFALFQRVLIQFYFFARPEFATTAGTNPNKDNFHAPTARGRCGHE
ncbi:hypothetical protein OAQ34_12220 [Opitutales bacterium]|nr:hypothetical protein [Opitutales bacterium]